MGLISAGSTIFDAGSMSAGFGGNMTFIKKLTASNSATLSFVNGSGGVVLDNTYKEYMFTYNNIHAESDEQFLTFQGSINSGTGYGITTTSNLINAHHNEADNNTNLLYYGGRDNEQSDAFIYLQAWEMGIDADQCCSGTLRIFDIANTAQVKHFMNGCNICHPGDFQANTYSSGYLNTTSAVNAFQFKMTSGNFNGDICLYGIV